LDLFLSATVFTSFSINTLSVTALYLGIFYMPTFLDFGTHFLLMPSSWTSFISAVIMYLSLLYVWKSFICQMTSMGCF
jgi:hypothetical protein